MTQVSIIGRKWEFVSTVPFNFFETSELSTQFRGQWPVGGRPSYSRTTAGHDRPHHTSGEFFHSITHSGRRAVSYIKVLAARKPVYGQIRFPPPTTLISPPPRLPRFLTRKCSHSLRTHFQATNLQLWLLEPFCNQCERANRLRLV